MRINRLTERDLTRIVRRVINEQTDEFTIEPWKDSSGTVDFNLFFKRYKKDPYWKNYFVRIAKELPRGFSQEQPRFFMNDFYEWRKNNKANEKLEMAVEVFHSNMKQRMVR